MKTLKNKIVYEKNINNLDWKSSAVVFPDSMQEIKSIVKLGAGNGNSNGNSSLDIVARGSGTSFTGGVIPNNSVIIDFSKMNKILAIDTNRKIAVVEPGVLVSELNEELEKFNLEFPIVPLFSGIETLGGMLAKNSSGSREIKYGKMMSWTDSLEIIDSKGEQTRISKSDLSDFIGLEGTTGLIVQATLRLTNKKNRTLTILRANTLQDVFIANRKLRLKQDVCSVDLINPTISSFLGLENKYHLFLELENEEGNFKKESYDNYMKLKSKFYKKAASEGGFIYLSNAKFLIDSLQDFLIYLEEQKIPYFAHLVSGVVCPLFRQEDLIKMSEAARMAKKFRGRIAYSFGIGLTKKDALEAGEIDLIRRIKVRRDPCNKFNRNKLIDADLVNVRKHEETEEKPKEGIRAEEPKKEETQKEEFLQAEITAVKRKEPELSPEEREKIKKIAGGFFASGKKE